MLVIEKRVDRITVVIGPDYAGLLDLMSGLEQRDKTELVRIMIDHRAALAGLEPLGQVVLPPALEDTGERSESGARGTYSIGADYIDLLEELGNKERRDKTRLVRIMIDQRAALAGLEPLGPVVPPPMPEDAITA